MSNEMSAATERLLRDSADVAALRHKLALINIAAQHRLAWYRSHYSPDQPRVPAGNPRGGQWTSEGNTESGGRPQTMSDVTPDNLWKPGAQYAGRGPRRGSGRIGGEAEPGQAARLAIARARAADATARVRALDPDWRPGAGIEESIEARIRAYEAQAEEAEARLRELAGFELPPIIPKERPATKQEQHAVARELARWLVKNHGQVIEGAAWLLEFEPSIEAYLDPPKTLEELHQAVSNPKPGYEIHHIVEQTPAENEKFPRTMIDAPDNLVRIPKFKHWEINGWYGQPNKAFGGASPREYLRGKAWDERIRIGLYALIKHEVLKP